MYRVTMIHLWNLVQDQHLCEQQCVTLRRIELTVRLTLQLNSSQFHLTLPDWNNGFIPCEGLMYQEATGLAAGTGRRTMGVEMVPSPKDEDTCTELLGLRIVLDMREMGPYLLTMGGSKGMNSSSVSMESELWGKIKVDDTVISKNGLHEDGSR